MEDARQFNLDTFYHKHGKCCAGCDWWRSLNSVAGECTNSAPVSGEQRTSMLGIVGMSWRPEPGHQITDRAHACGDFKDEFDWSSLPLSYLKRIGAQLRKSGQQPSSS